MAIGNHNDLTHIVRTSDQWKNTYDKYELIPTGVLCVELVSSDVTKIKIGDGHNIFSKLPYIGDLDLSKYYTKLETDTRIKEILTQEKVVRIKGIIGSKSDLPADAKCGDIYFVRQLSSSDNKYIEYIYSPDNTWEPLGGIPVDIDLSEYAKTAYVDDKIEQVNERIDDIEQHGTHTHPNKEILDQITEPYTTADKETLASLHNYDDTEIREMISQSSHTHSNKDILDATSAAFTKEDKSKLDQLNPYDDSTIKERITELERVAHEHSNKRILDQTTASFTKEYERKMRWIRMYTGCTGMEEGIAGLVPAAQAGEEDYVLSGSGEWVPQTGGGGTYELPIATASTLGGIKVGDGLEIDANGKLSVVGGGGGGDSITEGDGITITTDPQTGVKTISVNTGDHLSVDSQTGELNVSGVMEEFNIGKGLELVLPTIDTLPAGYGHVDYVKTSGAAYAELDYYVTVNTKVVGTATCDVFNNDAVVFGTRQGMGNNEFVMWMQQRSNDPTNMITGFVYGRNNWGTSTDANGGRTAPYHQGDQYNFETSVAGGLKINNQLLHNVTNYGDPSYTKLHVFACNGYGGGIYNGKMYQFKLYENDTLSAKLIPAVRLSDNAVGFYDVINDIFYISNASTPFTTDMSTLIIDDPTKVLNAKIGNGLRFDSNNAIEVNTGDGLQINQDGELEIDPSIIPDITEYRAGEAIDIKSITRTLEPTTFSNIDYIASFSGAYNGRIEKNADGTEFTITAIGSDAYTEDNIGSESNGSYPYNVESSTKYRLTWDATGDIDAGGIIIFENGRYDIMHNDYASAEYIEFTTSANTTFFTMRCGVSNNGQSITFSNFNLYRVLEEALEYDEISVKYNKGLTVNQDNELEVNAGDGLTTNSDGELEVNAGRALSVNGSGELGVDIATANSLGVVKAGSGLNIDEFGNLSTQAAPFRVGRALSLDDESVRLPSAYYKAKYVQSDGDARCVTEFYPSNYPNAKYVGTASVIGDTNGYKYIFGTQGDNYHSYWSMILSTSNDNQSIITGLTYNNNNDKVNNPITTSFTKGDMIDFEASITSGLKLNNELVQSLSTAFTKSTYNMFIFGEQSGYTTKARIYSFKIYNSDDTLLANFVPAVRKSDNEVGFYETVSNQFINSNYYGPPFTTDMDDLDVDEPDWVLNVDIATANSLGVIKPGTGLTVSPDGTLNVTETGGDTVEAGDGIDIDTDSQTGNKVISVVTGNGLQINQDGELEIDPSIIPDSYEAGDGIEITEVTHEDEFRVLNQEYFFDTHGLTCGLNARVWTTVNDGDILAAMCIHNSGGNQVPLFVGLTEDSVKVSQNYDSTILGPNGSFDYLGKTWYFTADYALSGTDGQDTQGHIQTLPTIYSFNSTPSNFVPAAKDLIDLAVLLSDIEHLVISVKYKEGLILNQYGELAVNVGDGLYIDTSAIDPTEFNVQNQEYFFNTTNVTATINGTYGPRSFVKLYADDCLFALCNQNNYNTPILVGLTADSVKIRVDGNYGTASHGPNITFDYRGKTWYCTSGYGLSNGTMIDQTGTVQVLPTEYSVSTEAEYEIIGKDLIDAAILLPSPDITTVNAKLGNGLSFDEYGAIQADAQPLSPATDSTLGGVIVGEGLEIDNDGTISVDPTIIPEVPTYEAGTAISIEDAEHGGVTFDAWDSGTGWENVCYQASTGNAVVTYTYEAHSPISNSYTIPTGATHIRAIAYDQNDTMLWTSFSWIDANNYHFASTTPENGHYDDWFIIPTGAVKVNFGVRHSKLDTTTAMSLNDIKSVDITIQTVSEIEVDVWNGGSGWLNGNYYSGISDTFTTSWPYSYHSDPNAYIPIPNGATHLMVMGISNENDSHFEGGGVNVFSAENHSNHIAWWSCAWKWHEISSDAKFVQIDVKWNDNNTRTISAANIKSVTLVWKLPALEINTAINVKYGDGLTVNQNNELEVSPATENEIGGIKIGSGFTYLIDGTLNAKPAMPPFEVGNALELLYDDPDALPTGYAHVDYVSSNPASNSTSSTNYGRARTLIDYTPENVTKLEIKMARDNDYQDSCFVGCRVSGSENQFVLWHENRSPNMQVAFVYGSKTYNDAKVNVSYVTGQVQEIEANIPPAGTSGNINVLVNGNVVKTYAKTGSPLAYKLGIFQSNKANEWEYQISNGRIYYLRLYEGNTLAVNLIPAVRLVDEAVGFYDNVNDKFYTSSTDYPFTTDMSTVVIDGAQRTLNVKYNNGLILNQNNELEVNIGTGLEFDQVTGAINVIGGGGSSEEGNLIVEGDGIEINSLSFNIPKNYAGISYIEGNGQQWTQLDYMITHDTRVVIEMSSYETETTSRAIFGSRRSENPQFVTWLTAINGSDYIKTAFVYGSNEYDHYYDTTIRRGNRFTLDASVNGLYINNTLIQSITDQGTMPTDKLGLFAIANGDGTYETSKGMGKYRIFSVKIYDGNSLEMDLVPLLYLDYEHTAKIPGLYDLINETFYPSLTSTDFVYDASSIIYPVYEVSAKLGNSLQFDQNDAIEVKAGDGLSIDPITGELFVDGQLPEGTIIKKLTYMGDGGANTTIQFDKKPLAIITLYGQAVGNKCSAVPTVIDANVLMSLYGTGSISQSDKGGTVCCEMSYDDSTNVLTLSKGYDAGARYNISGETYQMFYLTKGHTGSGTSVNNEVSVIKTFSYVGTGTSTNNIQFPETPDMILDIHGPLATGDITTAPIEINHPTTNADYMTIYTQHNGGSNTTNVGYGTFSFNDSTNVLTLTGGDYGDALNYSGGTYYVRYIVNEVIPTTMPYDAGEAISIETVGGLQPTDYSNNDFVTSIASINGGTIVKAADNSSFTLTASLNDCYTRGSSGQANGLYPFNVKASTKYRFAWDSADPDKYGVVYVFENGQYDNMMHTANQHDASYIEFTTTAQTSYIQARFGVAYAGNSITYSNVRLYEVIEDEDQYDEISVKYNKGLSVNQNNELEVNIGTGLAFDPQTGAINVTGGGGGSGDTVSQGAGIEITTDQQTGNKVIAVNAGTGLQVDQTTNELEIDDSVLTEDDELNLVFVPDDYQPS